MRLSVAEAAARLGISPRAVRDRLQRGELKGELVSARSGATWLVDWSGEADEASADLLGLIGETVSESVGKTVAPLVARADELARENEQLRAQVAALEIAADEAETDDSAAADVAPDEASRSWWKR